MRTLLLSAWVLWSWATESGSYVTLGAYDGRAECVGAIAQRLAWARDSGYTITNRLSDGQGTIYFPSETSISGVDFKCLPAGTNPQ